MVKYKIHPIVVGSKLNEKGMITYQYDYGKQFGMPIYSWYLEGGDQKVVVDTGEMSPIITEHRESQIGGKIYTIEDGLAKYGIRPEDIDIVIHTHLHFDHCQNDYKFKKALFYAHEFELEHLHNPHPLDYRYLIDYLEDVVEKIIPVKGGEELVPGIQLIHTPAHTAGGLSVVVQTEAGRAIITGCCTLLENFFPPVTITSMGLEVIPPGTNINPYEAYDSMLKIKKLADILLPIHDSKFVTMDTIP